MDQASRAGLFFLAVFLLLAAGCVVPPKGSAPVAVPAAEKIAFEKFPVLEYHMIGRPEGRWQRTPENFRRDLEWLYSNNYYPLNLRDLLGGLSAVPPGKRPVLKSLPASKFRPLSCRQSIVTNFFPSSLQILAT